MRTWKINFYVTQLSRAQLQLILLNGRKWGRGSTIWSSHHTSSLQLDTLVATLSLAACIIYSLGLTSLTLVYGPVLWDAITNSPAARPWFLTRQHYHSGQACWGGEWHLPANVSWSKIPHHIHYRFRLFLLLDASVLFSTILSSFKLRLDLIRANTLKCMTYLHVCF